MAVVKIFDSRGIKTLVLAGNSDEQEYDELEKEDVSASEDTEAEE